MTDTPKVHAYAVSVAFERGLMAVPVIAPSREDAVGFACAFAGATKTEAFGNYTGQAAVELTPEWLRMALRAIETGKAEASVVSLVPKAEPLPTTEGVQIGTVTQDQLQQQTLMARIGRCPHGVKFAEPCPECGFGHPA